MVTASKIPAMMTGPDGEYLGYGYKSARELYEEMTGGFVAPIDAAKKAMYEDGHDVEPYGMNWWVRRHPEWCKPKVGGEVAYTNDDLPFPNVATLDNRAFRRVKGQWEHCIVEVKRPMRAKVDLPAGWYLQVMAQMLISGIRTAYLVAIPRYGEPQEWQVEWDPEVGDAIARCAAAFHQRVINLDPPELGASKYANEILAAEYPHGTGETLEADPGLMGDLIAAWEEADRANKAVTVLESRLKEQMKDAAKVTYDGISVVSRRAGRFAAKRVPEEHQHLLKEPEVQKTSLDTAKLKRLHPDVYAAACGPDTYTVERKKFLDT